MAKSRKRIAARKTSSKRKAGARRTSRAAAKRAPVKKGKPKVRRTAKNAIRSALEGTPSIAAVEATQLIVETPAETKAITSIERGAPEVVAVAEYESIQSVSSESGIEHGAPGPALP
jgi:phage repressor protein C with HTH and peptisase S24 domain